MKKKLIYIILLIIVGCSSKNIISKDQKNSHMVESYIYNSNSIDSVYLDLYIILSNKKFVYAKSNGLFKSNVDISISISDTKQGNQLLHQSWNETFIEQYYNKTRSIDKKNIIYRRFLLPIGEYKVFTFIQDADSKNNWVINKKLILKENQGISNPIVKEKKKNRYSLLIINKVTSQDSVFLFFQLDNKKEFNSDSFKVTINNTKIDNYKINTDLDLNSFYCLRIPVGQFGNNNPIIDIFHYDYKESIAIKYDYKKIEAIFPDPNQVLEIMFYYGFIDNYKEIKNQSDDYKYDYIKNYWLNLDSETGSLENNLMLEFNSRIQYSIKNFSDLGPGWRSDRGRILINYGYPSHKEESRNNDNGYMYLMWYYPSGKKVVFIDQDGFGDYKIYREM